MRRVLLTVVVWSILSSPCLALGLQDIPRSRAEQGFKIPVSSKPLTLSFIKAGETVTFLTLSHRKDFIINTNGVICNGQETCTGKPTTSLYIQRIQPLAFPGALPTSDGNTLLKIETTSPKGVSLYQFELVPSAEAPGVTIHIIDDVPLVASRPSFPPRRAKPERVTYDIPLNRRDIPSVQKSPDDGRVVEVSKIQKVEEDKAQPTQKVQQQKKFDRPLALPEFKPGKPNKAIKRAISPALEEKPVIQTKTIEVTTAPTPEPIDVVQAEARERLSSLDKATAVRDGLIVGRTNGQVGYQSKAYLQSQSLIRLLTQGKEWANAVEISRIKPSVAEQLLKWGLNE